MTSGSLERISALVAKDCLELSRNPGAFVPPIAIAFAALLPGVIAAVIAPMLSGESLGDSREFERGAALAAAVLPELAHLTGAALIQAFVFHQFMIFLLMVPVVGSMALAAHAVIGEKLARTLEPLLATPITTAELLLAKASLPFGVALGMMWTTVLLYLGLVRFVAEPGVFSALVGPRTALLFLVLGPLVGLVALQLAVIVSSRVNDARSAQQLGALVILPITGVFIAQLTGQFIFGTGALLISAAGLALVNAGLTWLGIRLFDRERILMKWK